MTTQEKLTIIVNLGVGCIIGILATVLILYATIRGDCESFGAMRIDGKIYECSLRQPAGKERTQ